MDENNNLNQGLEGNPVVAAKKLSRTAICGIAAVVVLLVATVGILAKNMFGGLSGTPQQIVIKAYQNTCDKLSKEQKSINEERGAAVVEDIMNSEAVSSKVNIGLDSVPGMEGIYATLIKGINFTGEVQYTKDGSKLNSTLAVKQGDLPIINLDFYKLDSEVGLNVPQLFDNPYMVNMDTFESDFAASDLATLMGVTEIPAETKEVLDAYRNYVKGAMDPAYLQNIVSHFNEVNIQTINDLTVIEAGTDKVTIGDAEKECKVYTADITPEQLKAYIESVCDMLLNEEVVKDYLEIMDATSGGTGEYTVEALKEQLNIEVEDLEGINFQLKFKVYDKYLVETTLAMAPEETAEDENVELTVAFNGDKYLLDSCNTTLRFEEYGDVTTWTLGVTSNYGENVSAKEQKVNFEMQMPYDESVAFTYTFTYDNKANTVGLDGEMSIASIDNISVKFNGTGTKTVDKSKKAVDVTFDTLSFEASEDGEKQTIVLSNVGYNMQAIKASDIIVNNEDAVNILTLSSEELYSIATGIRSKILSQLGFSAP